MPIKQNPKSLFIGPPSKIPHVRLWVTVRDMQPKTTDGLVKLLKALPNLRKSYTDKNINQCTVVLAGIHANNEYYEI